MRTVAVLLALLVVPFALPASQADVALVRVLAGDQTIADGEFTFRDYLLVPAGSTLTIRNATVWLDAERLCTGRTNLPAYRCMPQLDVRGTLVVEDSVFDTHRWTPSVDSGYIIHVEHGRARVVGSEFRHYLQVVFVQAGPAPSVMEDNEFRNGIGPIRIMQGAEVAFRRNLVESVRDGVRVTDAPPLIEDNHFLNVSEHYDAGGFNWAIEVTAASPNDHLWPSTAGVRGNVIDNATVGIVSQTGVPNVIAGNVIRNVRAGMLLGTLQDGIVLDREPPVVRRNVIDKADYGIRLSGNSATGPSPPTHEVVDLRDNVLANIGCHAIYVLPMANTVSITVDARDIWWGSSKGPSTSTQTCAPIRVEDDLSSVDASTWLRAPPRWVAPHLPDIMAS